MSLAVLLLHGQILAQCGREWMVTKYLAAKDLRGIEVYVICQAHLQLLLPPSTSR